MPRCRSRLDQGTNGAGRRDVFVIGGAINSLSRDHRDFIAAGGLGILIGDGALNYRRELILGYYYAYALTRRSYADGGLSIHHQPRLQRRSRTGPYFLGTDCTASFESDPLRRLFRLHFSPMQSNGWFTLRELDRRSLLISADAESLAASTSSHRDVTIFGTVVSPFGR